MPKILPKWRNFKENFEQARQRSAVNKIEDLREISQARVAISVRAHRAPSNRLSSDYRNPSDPNGIITAERLQNLIERTLQAPILKSSISQD